MFNFFKKKNQVGSDKAGVESKSSETEGKQSDANQLKTLELKIDGMHCGSCSMSIDGELEDLNGVESATTSYAKQETKVVFDESKVGQKQIVAVIEELGYGVEK